MSTPRRRLASTLLLCGAAVAAAGAVLAEGWGGVGVFALAVLMAAGFVITVPVPFGGAVPIGLALVISLAVLLEPRAFGLVATGGASGSVLIWWIRADLATAAREGLRVTAALGLAVLSAATLSDLTTTAGLGVIGRVLLVGAVVLLADALVSRRTTVGREQLHWTPAAPVYLTLLCAGALIAVASDRPAGAWMAAVALFPLAIVRFAFERHADAHRTFTQTVQALGIVPELAGLAPLGHSERSAVYAERLGRQLGLVNQDLDRVVLAARLHHLGAVSFDPIEATEAPAPVTPDDMAVQGAAILRESGFPDDVAELIEAARAGTLDGEAPTLEAAVVRMATAFDELVGNDPRQADRALAVVAGHPRDPMSRRAAAGLLALVAADPGIVEDAVAAGARFTDAAAGLDLDELVAGSAAGELLPFGRRRTQPAH